jgi:hypothetical protein
MMASREASSVAIRDLFVLKPGTGATIRLAAADATAMRSEALGSLGDARDEFASGWPLGKLCKIASCRVG